MNGCDALLLSLLCISFNLFTAIIGADNWLFPLCSSTPFYRIYFPRTYLTNPKKNRNTFKIENGPNSPHCLFPKLVQGIFSSRDCIENQRLVRRSSCYPLAFYWRARRKWRQREEMGGKISPTRAKNEVVHYIRLKIDQIRLEMDQKGLKLVFLYQKYLFWRKFCLRNIRFRRK